MSPESENFTNDIVTEIERTVASLRKETNHQRWAEFVTKKTGLPQLSLQMYTLISTISQCSPCRLSDVAKTVHVDASTASRQVQQLVEQGLIVESEDPSDRRASLHTLSEKGEATVAAIHEARHDFLQSVLSRWSEHDQREFLRLFRQFVSDLNRVQQQEGK